MIFVFDTADGFEYIQLDSWDQAEEYALGYGDELMGEHVETSEGPLWLTRGETTQ